MVFSRINETKQWKEMESKIKERINASLLKEEIEKEQAKEIIKEPFVYNIPNDLDYGYNTVPKAEFHTLAKQLTDWGVWNSGQVIKKEGAGYVRQAVYITKQNLNKIKTPGAYFRSVLKDLKNSCT